jgi:hypothetical protein
MIQPTSSTTIPASDIASKPLGPGQSIAHTPFGDVIVDELSHPDLQAAFGPKTPPTDPPAGAPAVAPAAVTAAVTAADTPAQPGAPTPQSVFGNHVWLDAPTGTAPNGARWTYNPIYFATRETAEAVAKMIGGTVEEMHAMTPYGVMQQDTPNMMVRMPDGRILNPGLIADFYNHGYPQQYIDMMIRNEVRA